MTIMTASDSEYRLLFESNPNPMWVYDLRTLTFLAVNEAAVRQYGYTRDEFLRMSIADIRPKEDVARLHENITKVTEGLDLAGIWRHTRKDGTLIDVEITSHTLTFAGRKAELVLAHDVTSRLRAESNMARIARLYAFLGEINQVIVREHDRDAFQKAICQVAVTYGQFPAAWIIMGDAQTRSLVASASARLANDVASTPIDLSDASPVHQAIRENRIVVAPDWLVLPLAMNKTAVGALILDTSIPREIHPEEYQLLDEIADDISYALDSLERESQQKRAERHLKESESRFRTLFETMSQGVVYQDRSGAIIDANPAAEHILGLTLDQMRGRASIDPRWRAIREDGAELSGVDHPAMIALRSGKPVNNVVMGVFNPQDESHHWILVNAIPQYLPNESVPHQVFATFTDITDRKRAEEAMRVSEEEARRAARLMEALFDAIPDVLGVQDNQHRILRYNAAGYVFLGLSPEQVRGRKCHELIGHLNPCDVCATAESMSHKRPAQVEKYVPEIKRWIEARAYPVFNEHQTIEYVIEHLRDITERRQAEEAIKEKNEFISSLLRAIPVAVFYKDNEGRYLGCNETFTEHMGVTSEGIRGKTVHELWPGEMADRYHQMDLELMRTRKHQVYEFQIKDKHGMIRPVIYAKDVFLDKNGNVAGLVGAFLDISERKRAELDRERLQAQLLASQKLESVGRLAGGVAHDFNNMLTAILGQAELAMMRCDPADPLYARLRAIEEATTRSANLVRQLLAFARKQPVAPKIIDLNNAVAGMLQMLRRIIGEDIDLVWIPGGGLWSIRIDPSQVDQILTNLCVNARDAIEAGGKIEISTENVLLDAEDSDRFPGIAPGAYVLLSVRDNGCGMDAEIIDHIFEPFFTTKGAGQGTGLGLATVFGIIKQNEGYVDVQSEPGAGSVFLVYLPRFAGAEVTSADATIAEMPRGRGELILLVEDEPGILDAGRAMLSALGYQVLTASCPSEAIECVRTQVDMLHLLITDVVMPGMNGRDLVSAVRTLRPNIRYLYISGYTANIIAQHGILEEGTALLPKPFSMKDLAEKVRAILDGPAPV